MSLLRSITPECCPKAYLKFKDLITDKTPLIGIEPSAILTFRDEYLRLADDKKSAKKLSENCFTIEEFLANEHEKKNIDTSNSDISNPLQSNVYYNISKDFNKNILKLSYGKKKHFLIKII